MICALHRERRQSLPAERLQLYRQCVEMLLSGREEVRKLDFGQDYPDLSYDQKLVLIQHLAYWLMRNGHSDVAASEADELFDGKLALMNKPDVTGQGVRRLFVDRTSLLREPMADRIDFTHRTFQEYLAAQAAVKENDIGLLVQRSLDDQWREMIILAAGEARPQESDKLLKGLVAKGDKLKRKRNRHQLYLLACACLETCIELAPSVRELVLQKAAALIPPRDDDEVKLIAAARDPVTSLLAYRPQYNGLEAGRCVDALAMIGSNKAMEILVDYALEDRGRARHALGSGWSSFDRIRYAKEVLAHSKHLVIYAHTSWEGFEYLSRLIDLEVWDSGLTSVEPLTSLQQLTILNLLSWSHLVDINPLCQLPNLTELYLQEFDQLCDLGPLARCTQLKCLILSGCRNVVDLSVIARLEDLRKLWIRSMPFSDLSPLVSLINLQKLDISGTWVNDLSPLARLTNLQRLDISKTQVNNLSSLAHLSNLKELRISKNSSLDLSPLEGKAGLEIIQI